MKRGPYHFPGEDQGEWTQTLCGQSILDVNVTTDPAKVGCLVCAHIAQKGYIAQKGTEMSTTIEDKKQRVRKPRPRATAVVLGALEERLSCAGLGEHQTRVMELLDELRRSLSGKTDEED